MAKLDWACKILLPWTPLTKDRQGALMKHGALILLRVASWLAGYKVIIRLESAQLELWLGIQTSRIFLDACGHKLSLLKSPAKHVIFVHDSCPFCACSGAFPTADIFMVVT
jgi:hypothetical protein